MWFTQCQSFSSYTHVFPLALNASKVRPQYWYSKKGKNIQFYTFAFSWTGSEFDCIWILLFEGWILPEGGSQSLWRLQCLDGIPTGRASQARGGQQIPLAHSQAFLELQCKKTAPLVRIAQCSTECYMYMSCLRWEPQGPWPFSRPALLVFRVCWWTVQLSISSLLFKALSHLCLTDLRFFFPFFVQCLHQHCTWYPGSRNKLCSCAVCSTHCCTSRGKLHPHYLQLKSGRRTNCGPVWDLQAILNPDHWSSF